MQFNISGTTLQTVSIDLQAGETVYSQRNVMAWMTDNVQMNTTSMPIMNLAEEIGKFLPQREVREAAGGGIVGGVIGSILKGE